MNLACHSPLHCLAYQQAIADEPNHGPASPNLPFEYNLIFLANLETSSEITRAYEIQINALCTCDTPPTRSSEVEGNRILTECEPQCLRRLQSNDKPRLT